MHYSFWVAYHPQGIFLIDTGFYVPDMYWAADSVWRTVEDVLAVLRIDPLDVVGVILTHYHFDHAGHVDLFPNATVYADRHEHERWIDAPQEELRKGFIDPRHLEAIRIIQAEGRLVLVEGRTEIVPGITTIPAPGHTPGQVAVLVQTASGPRLLASDAAHLYEQLELGWRFFAHTDTEQSDRTIAFLKQLAADEGAPLIPGHDSRVSQRFPALEGPASSFVTVLG